MRATTLPALVTVRGFLGTPVISGSSDSDSDNCTASTSATSPFPVSVRRHMHSLPDDPMSSSSPMLDPQKSPGISSISKLRMKMEPLSLDTSRCSSLSRTGLHHETFPIRRKMLGPKQSMTRDPSCDGSEAGSSGYEISLRDDFVSETTRDPHDDYHSDNDTPFAVLEDVDAPPRRKISALDFEPLRCLGKGAFGTVLLVKHRATGRLYAQKQFKKASLVVHKKLVEQTKTERQILESVNQHPFVVKLYYAFQDLEKLYLILEYGQGGELFTYLNAEKMLSEPTAAFYMAEMLLAISHLHGSLGVIYRDLKPENCLLDADGHLLLTDFGLSKVSAEPSDQCDSMLGTVEYMAPEVIKGLKYGKAVDWWSFGALGYDLLTGSPPFRGQNHAKILENIVKQKLVLPYFLSPDAKDLLIRLLRKDPVKRLGASMPRDLNVLKAHRFFRRIDWLRLAARDLQPPIQPLITDPELAENFAPEFTNLSLRPLVSAASSDIPWSDESPKEDVFGGFSFVAPSNLLERDCCSFSYPRT